MELKRLGDYVKIKTGKLDANASSENGKYPFFTCSVNNLWIDKFAYDCECVLIAGNGDLNVKYYEGKFNAYQRTYIVESSDKTVLDVRFLYYFMNKYIDVLRSNSIGGVIKYIKLGDLTDAHIPLPPLETQKKIVEVLDKAQGLIDARKEQIRLMDELIQSVFYEMFGDGKYPLVKTQDVCDFITKGTTPKAGNIFHEYSEGLIPFIKVYNLSFDGTMLFDEKQQFITSDIHSSELSRSAVYPNDVLMNIVGPPLGKFSIVPSTYKEWNINQAIAIFRAKDEVIPQFLLYALMQPKVIQPFINSAVGIRQQNLNLAQCRDLEIPLPPLSLQNSFSIKVQQIQTTKTLLESSLSELENNLNGLMHNAFSGSLFHNLFAEKD
jgi:type I restriction enzyme S subunit